MAWIDQVSDSQATGFLKKQFDDAMKRSGRIWNVVRIMSPNPRVMDANMKLYGALMHGDSPLTRMQRELLATVTSAELNCRY